MTEFTFARKLVAESIGTVFLLATVVGSGIMAESLAGGNVAIALLGNTLATGCILMVLILIFGPVSGAHFNPAVTLSFWLQHQISGREAVFYVVVQTIAAIGGAALAHVMFDMPDLVMASTKERTGVGIWTCLLYTSPSPRDVEESRMPSSA